MKQTSYTICNFCDSTCGLEVTHENSQILSIKGDKENVFSKGHLCIKGKAQQDLYEDPDRLRQPMQRVGDRWQPISWQQAFATIGDEVGRLQSNYGDDAIGLYYGNPITHNYASLLSLLAFVTNLGTKNLFSANTVDSAPRMLASLQLYNNQALVPIPDIERTDYFLILGSNPMVSNGSAMSAPDVRRRFKEMRQRGAKIVVIDPRFTETAKVADEHHFITPGSDAYFLLAMLNVMFRENLLGRNRLGVPVKGLVELEELADGYAPEVVAERTGIAAEAIVTIAREFAAANRAACFGRMGTCTQEFGTLATWLIDVINIVTGNLDREGGAMFPTPAADLAGLARFIKQTGFFNRWQSRTGSLPEFNGELPVAALADEIETAGVGQIKGMITVSGNPILSLPNGRRLERAFASLEFMVAVDFYINETTRHANIILPPVTMFEGDHYPMLEYSISVRNVANFAEPVFAKPANGKDDWEILVGMLQAINARRGLLTSTLTNALLRVVDWLQPEGILDLLLRLGPQKTSLAELKKHKHGVDFGELEPRLKKVINTADGAINLLPDLIRNDLGRLRRRLTPDKGGDDSFLLISQRTLRSINSWMHNSERLAGGKSRCVLSMSEDDAKRLGATDGQTVLVRSRVGEIKLPVAVSDEMMPGVVAMPFGWGHNREGTRMAVASNHPGVSMNDVSDDTFIDEASGTSVLDGIPVTVRLAEKTATAKQRETATASS